MDVAHSDVTSYPRVRSTEGDPAIAGYSTKLYAAWDGPPTGSGSFTIDYAADP